MAWVKVPPENHPIFREALPRDGRVETQLMFGGVAAKVNGHLFAGLFGRSVMLQLAEPERTAALALEGAGPFDPMGDGRARSDKVMLPEAMMDDPDELRRWIGKAFTAAARLPAKAAQKASKKVSKKASKKVSEKASEKAAAKAPAPRAKSKRPRNER
jgi:TfoX/Sxy family transcriptional regulator of competence genes